MATLLYTDPRFAEHWVAPGHPERPERLEAVDRGIAASGVAEDLVPVTPREATSTELALVHDPDYISAIRRFCESGGGNLDPDTQAGPRSWEAALLAAGAGLDAVARIEDGDADTAFCAVRPPGHHATASRAMGFCLFNNVAVVAAALAERGERVVIVDIDAHHGNGTQDIFWDDARVTYVSIHEHPMYPGSGRLGEMGGTEALGRTVNVPVPAHTGGDTYRAALDLIVAPVIERVGATWLLISTGFDAHRADPLTGLGLSSGDFGDLTARLLAMAPAGRSVVFLEGGYDLDAVAASTAATVAALSHVDLRPEMVTTGPDLTNLLSRIRGLHDL